MFSSKKAEKSDTEMMSKCSCKIWLNFIHKQMFGKASKPTIEKSLPTLLTPPYGFFVAGGSNTAP
jgi:hypothetical protein